MTKIIDIRLNKWCRQFYRFPRQYNATRSGSEAQLSRRKLMNSSCCGGRPYQSKYSPHPSFVKYINPVLTLLIARMNVAHERRQVTSDGSRGSTVSGDHAAVGRHSLGTTPPWVDSLWGPRRRLSTVSGDHAAVVRQSVGTTPPLVDSLWGPRRHGTTVSRDHTADDIPNVSVRC